MPFPSANNFSPPSSQQLLASNICKQHCHRSMGGLCQQSSKSPWNGNSALQAHLGMSDPSLPSYAQIQQQTEQVLHRRPCLWQIQAAHAILKGNLDIITIAAMGSGKTLVFCEMTKLTQELAVRLEQGRDLRQWHSMANWEVIGETLCVMVFLSLLFPL